MRPLSFRPSLTWADTKLTCVGNFCDVACRSVPAHDRAQPPAVAPALGGGGAGVRLLRRWRCGPSRPARSTAGLDSAARRTVKAARVEVAQLREEHEPARRSPTRPTACSRPSAPRRRSWRSNCARPRPRTSAEERPRLLRESCCRREPAICESIRGLQVEAANGASYQLLLLQSRQVAPRVQRPLRS